MQLAAGAPRAAEVARAMTQEDGRARLATLATARAREQGESYKASLLALAELDSAQPLPVFRKIERMLPARVFPSIVSDM